ncbi:MAG TPA: UDP-glucose 4-epimerase GalE [Candidatus Acidoferrum sp.]|jgi:UDP-glucose 4-epimerase
MAETILVTGGAGYIGSVVVAQLLDRGYQPIVLDDLSHGHRTAIPSQAQFVEGNIADRGALDRTFSGFQPQAVVHFAASIEAGESMQHPEKYFRNNTANTLTLLECMLAHGVRRFVFSSTAALYGNPEKTPIEEDSPLRPTNAYGESKLLVEQMLEWLQRIHGLRYSCLRYFNAAGAAGDQGEDHQPESHLIPIALQVALGVRKDVAIFGTDYPTPDGTCVRDYVHVSDLAAAHLLVLEALKDNEKLIYNLGNGRGFSVREVIDTVRKVTGRAISSQESPRRPGDPAVLVASSEKIKRELNWQPRHTDLESVVRSAWNWRRAHPNGYDSHS